MSLVRVKMVRCVGPEPLPPDDPEALERWCAQGNSAVPVQEHLGDEGVILWVNPGESVCVQFDNGDERLLFREEFELVREP